MIKKLFSLSFFTWTLSFLHGEKPHAVFVVGTHHYSPQKSMPMLASETERLGFKTTVINPDWDPEKDKRGLPGLEALKKADLAVFYTRFLKIDDLQLVHITDYLKSGKPVVGFRTSTHGFNYPDEHPNQKWNDGFGRDAFGSPYRIHLSGPTRLKVEQGRKKHPVFTGVQPDENWESRGTLYLTKMEKGTTPLLLGTGHPRDKKAAIRTNRFGTHHLEPEMTDVVAWTWTNKWGGRTFFTSLGHLNDFWDANSVRLIINGIFWAADLAVPSPDTKINTFEITSSKKKKKFK